MEEKSWQAYHYSTLTKLTRNGFQAVKDFNLENRKTKSSSSSLDHPDVEKSTTLRMIAGLEEISGGTLKIGDKVMNDVEPKRP